MTLPLIHLSGSPYEQGSQHGEALREQIAHNLDLYFARFAGEVGLDRAEVLGRARRYLAALQTNSSDFYAGLLGLAAGSGFPLDELAALNVRYEILYYQFGANAMADGCTAFAIERDASANGHVLLGQNWDWIPGVQGALLQTNEPGGLQTLSFTEAGIFGGKIGLNSAGVGLAVNGLTSTSDNWARLSAPFHARCSAVLRAGDFDRAIAAATHAQRACTSNFLIAHASGQIADVEAAPDTARLIEAENGCLVHTNHLLDPDALGVAEPPSDLRPGSCQRYERMSALLERHRPATIADLQAALADHDGQPKAICRHVDPNRGPAEQYVTVVAAIMDLETRSLSISDGPPCTQAFDTYRLH
ncbi:MAG TPA: C45 family peptidase [Roseiflexaceae bacterium]|nr:C45 family peptidase [Roseiflexaceae bacterium]